MKLHLHVSDFRKQYNETWLHIFSYRSNSENMKHPTASLLVLFCNYFWMSDSQLNLNLNAIQYWASEFGKNILERTTKAAAVLDIRTDYLLMDVKVKKLDGSEMLREIKVNLEHMLGKKVQSVHHLVRVAEKSFTRHPYDNQIKFHYFNSKKLNITEFELVQDDHFNNIPVNLTHSTVHVPTNVYNESIVILNGVAWSDALNAAFIDNHKNDPTLTWQYFCSASGFLRSYPGTQWRTNLYADESGVDTFDCRVRDWYLQAAAYPKDLVVLLDSSGSMRGLRIQIARATVDKLLDTLNDDDFFNIIQYSDTPKYINTCFNGTLIQATDSNKIKAKSALMDVKTQGIANLEDALVEAFELFQSMYENKRGAMCNKAIMIVTDGAVQNYEDVFAKYNLPRKNIRVFTYLIGREVGDSRDLKSMACKNNGSFSHITSLADVHEHVQEYIHVISRPMIISRANHTSWTNVYSDSHSPVRKGLDVMTTISKPVFDIRKETTNQGILLGVVGTDVPLIEMTKLISTYKIGVNGYSYAITSNGYALFHPRLKPRQPNLSDSEGAFNAVDLSDLEPLDVERRLRNSMVERRTDFLKLKAFVTYDEGRRARLRDNIYFFTEIKDTPFSVGISLPEEYGLFSIDGKRNVSYADISALSSGDIIIAPWSFCKDLKVDQKTGSLGMMLKIINETKHNYGFLRKNKCDVELLESFVFDAEATRGATASWVKENHEESFGDNLNKNDIELVFIGTKGGLTRYMILSEHLTDPDFLRTNTSTIEELYYQRATDNGEDIFTFSVPLQSAKSGRDMSDCVVTASTPITVTDNDKSAVAAVVGLQMKYSFFAETFRNASRKFPPLSHSSSGNDIGINYTCDDSELKCYLLDENGFVVFSENSRDVGQFFGSLQGMSAFLDEVTIDETEEYNEGKAHTTRFLKRLQMIDNRASCDIVDGYGSSSSNLLARQFNLILSWFINIINEVFIFLIQLDGSNLWRSIVGADDKRDVPPSITSNPDYEVYYEGLDFNDSDLQSAMVECAKLEKKGFTTKMLDCMREVQKSYKKIPAQRLCTRIYTYYMTKDNELPASGSVTKCQDTCTNSYSVNHVAGTNLMLYVVDNSCNCTNEKITSFESQEIYYNQSFLCQKMQSDVFRSRPGQCFSYHPMEKTECGTSNSGREATFLTLCVVLISLVLSR